MTSTNTLTVGKNFGSLVCIALVLFFSGCVAGNALANPGYIPKSIDINKADTTVFIALPGIGSKLASRIVAYREKLHGFYTVEQVAETFGLADSTFQKIKPWLVVTEIAIEKVNINTASVEELKTPYISYNLANAIYQFRLQHGQFTKLEDLKKIMLVDETLFNKICPYLTVG
jgi:competence ComEA-like helix-hairpin-helix protein